MRSRWVIWILALFTVLFAAKTEAQGVIVHSQPLPARPSPQPTPEQIAKMPVVALPIEEFKLLSAGTGWASTGDRLFLTKDNGAHWKDISPPSSNQDHYADVFFLDAATGWVLFSHPVQDGEHSESNASFSDWKLYLSFTVDGGSTWTAASLPEWHGERGLSDQGVIAFADKLHGWLSLGVDGNTVTAGSALLLTSDGGRSWHDTPDAKEGPEGRIRGILALTERDVWILGTPEGGPAMLWATHDGGNSYQQIALPALKEIAPAEYPTYSLPTFTDGLHGYEAVSYSGGHGEKSTAVLYATLDGGRTWKPDRTLSNLAEQETVGSTVFCSTWILPFASQGSQPTLVKVHPNDKTEAPTHKSSGDFNNCEIEFVTAGEGWMNCPGSLSATIDGGNSWTTVAPRVRRGVLTSDAVTPLETLRIQTHTTNLPGTDRAAIP
ncbi:MAG: hypothetical protein ABSG51_04000 [Terracidiphilus sp.]|jgi:photosystem II stability/assembly factor-like uncharacterized protein